MKYVISGKSDSYLTYVKNNKKSKTTHVLKKKQLDQINEDDTIVLLNGWWGRSWAKESIKEIVKAYPAITFEYLDGQFGERERNDLKSENISNRFDILDL